MKDYRKQVKISLIEHGMTQRQLCKKVSEKLGIEADETYICNVIVGRATSAPVVRAINEILGLGKEEE